jgi:hypothetical protein
MRRGGWLPALGAGLALGALLAGGPARADDPIRVYNCMEASEAMNQRWEEKLGIKTALLRMSCGEMWARIQAESKEGTNPGGIQADLVVSVLPDQVLIGKAQRLWLPHPKSPGWQGISPAYIDPDGDAYNLGTFSWLLYGNEPRLKEKGYEAPRGHPRKPERDLHGVVPGRGEQHLPQRLRRQRPESPGQGDCRLVGEPARREG